MPCSDYEMRVMNRHAGQSVTSTLAYQCRTTIVDERTGVKKYSHANKADLIETQVFLPEGADPHLKNVSVFANAIEHIERDRLGRRGLLVLPLGVSHEHHAEMVRLFIGRSFTSQGLPAVVAYHEGSERNRKNIHAHFFVADRPIIDGQFAVTKSRSVYVDELGHEIKPIDSPDLTRKGQLKVNADGTIKTKKGYLQLVTDKAGQPLYDKEGKVRVIDIRVPVIDESTGKQKMNRNGKYQKPEWKRGKVPLHDLDEFGIHKRLRTLWQDCQNEILKKRGYDLRIDLRSLKEQETDLPELLKTVPYLNEGVGPQAKENRKTNKIIRQHKEMILPLQKIYRSASKEKQQIIEYNLKLIEDCASLERIQLAVNSVMNERKKTNEAHTYNDKKVQEEKDLSQSKLTGKLFDLGEGASKKNYPDLQTFAPRPSISSSSTSPQPANENIKSDRELAKEAAIKKLVPIIATTNPNMNKEQIKTDLENLPAKSFDAVVRLYLYDTQEGKSWEMYITRPKKKKTSLARNKTKENQVLSHQ